MYGIRAMHIIADTIEGVEYESAQDSVFSSL